MRPLRSFWFISILGLVHAHAALLCQGQPSKQAIELLASDAAALSARLAMIESAKIEIEISSYHIESGTSTTAILNALQSAARRGVRVRLLLDGLNMKLSTTEMRSLQQEGIQIREFHPTGTGRLLRLNQRLHSKLFIIDGEFLILGSRNLRDKHFGFESDRYEDFELILQGDVAGKAVGYFDWVWNSCHVRAAQGKPNTRAFQRRACDAASPMNCSAAPFAFKPQFHASICCLHDNTINKVNKHMQKRRIDWVQSARHSLMIETPYPAFSKASLKAIEAAASRGVRVQIFTNSNASSDQPLTWAALQNVRRRLLRRGVEIYEYQGTDTMHAKMFLVDGKFAVFGSHNFDARSDNFNLEFCIKVDSAELTDKLKSRLECRRLQSCPVTRASPTRNQPPADRAKTRIRQLTALLIRPLL